MKDIEADSNKWRDSLCLCIRSHNIGDIGSPSNIFIVILNPKQNFCKNQQANSKICIKKMWQKKLRHSLIRITRYEYLFYWISKYNKVIEMNVILHLMER